MEALAERLYRRWPARFLDNLMLLAAAVTYLMLGPLGLVLIDGVLGLRSREVIEVVVFLAVGTVVAMVTTQATARSRRPAAYSWTRGDRSDPEASWTQMQTAPFLAATVYTVVLVSLLLVGLPWAITRDDPSTQAAVGLAVALVVAALVGWVLSVLGFEVALRPVLTECSAAIGNAHTPPHGWRLRGRLLLVLVAYGLAVGMFAAVGVFVLDPTTELVLLVSAATALVGAVWGMLFYAGVVLPSVLRPLRDLIDATTRVASGDYTQPVPLASADELGELAGSFNAMQRGLLERESLHAAFGTFVDPSLTNRLLELGDDAFAGELAHVSILFVDVRGFTTYAGTVEPDEAVAMLNQLFGVVVPIVRRHRGHPNHFLGDGLLAIFGAPEPLEDHADHAVAAAREMQHSVFAEFGESLRIGVGINSGKVIAGTIGGGGKLEYTVIGDAVNLAARVEQLTKITGDSILVTEATGALLSDHRELVDKGRHEIRGKAEPVHLFAVRC